MPFIVTIYMYNEIKSMCQRERICRFTASGCIILMSCSAESSLPETPTEMRCVCACTGAYLPACVCVCVWLSTAWWNEMFTSQGRLPPSFKLTGAGRLQTQSAEVINSAHLSLLLLSVIYWCKFTGRWLWLKQCIYSTRTETLSFSMLWLLHIGSIL